MMLPIDKARENKNKKELKTKKEEEADVDQIHEKEGINAKNKIQKK